MSLSDQAKSAIKEYLTLDKRIEEFEKSLKALKARKTLLQSSIFKHMKQNDIKQVNLPQGQKLQTYTRKSRPGTSKKWVEERLTLYCQRKSMNYEELYDFIYDPQYRPQIEKTSLKKTKTKVKK